MIIKQPRNNVKISGLIENRASIAGYAHLELMNKYLAWENNKGSIEDYQKEGAPVSTKILNAFINYALMCSCCTDENQFHNHFTKAFSCYEKLGFEIVDFRIFDTPINEECKKNRKYKKCECFTCDKKSDKSKSLIASCFFECFFEDNEMIERNTLKFLEDGFFGLDYDSNSNSNQKFKDFVIFDKWCENFLELVNYQLKIKDAYDILGKLDRKLTIIHNDVEEEQEYYNLMFCLNLSIICSKLKTFDPWHKRNLYNKIENYGKKTNNPIKHTQVVKIVNIIESFYKARKSNKYGKGIITNDFYIQVLESILTTPMSSEISGMQVV